nr:sodium/proton-translocating pyrophosphatase [Candidatus Sigynarchaeota archaeon]
SALLYAGVSAVFTGIISANVSANIVAKLWATWGAGIFGLAAGLVIGITTDYFTDDSKKPTQQTAEAAQKGHALVILTGFSYGLLSVGPPLIGIAVATVVSFLLNGFFGVANAAVGMLAIVCTIVSNDAYGPITDNARGLAEQGQLEESVIAICDKLDSAGNTAKAITKGFAIGAGALTVLGLLFSYSEEIGEMTTISPVIFNLLEPNIMVGALIGAMIPPVYSAILIKAVDKNAEKMVDEIRRQFKENPGLLEGKGKADYARCVDIATKGALVELIVPSILAVGAPLAVGLLFGVLALGSFLATSIATGFVFGVLMGNAGGTWDNAKKYVEDGHFGGKGSPAHAAAVTGDTVGDPFKDTAGPSINTLLAVMGLTASMFIVLFTLVNGGAGLIAVVQLIA